MKNYGRTSVSEFLGDFVAFRKLRPVDTRLPSLEEIKPIIGLGENDVPRKMNEVYAKVVIQLFNTARFLDAPGSRIERFVVIGDTELSDGTAFKNICKISGWRGFAFIGSEKKDKTGYEIQEGDNYKILLSNRWSVLREFDQLCKDWDFAIDETTAVLLDLDKTAVGARGRNDHVIDQVRVGAIRSTVGNLLGENFNPENFQFYYDSLNKPEFHKFTTDNQDYLAYICLILGSGILKIDDLVHDIRTGKIQSFKEFVNKIHSLRKNLSANLRQIHKEFYICVQNGDPTPFKAFRYKEYQTTVDRMGNCDDDTAIHEMLQQEIVITQEVRELALDWKKRGALLFGFSDKPDEASSPIEALAKKGYKPFHKVETHAVGE